MQKFIQIEDAETKEKAREYAIENFGFDPAHIIPVYGGWAAFSDSRCYNTWKNQK